MEPPIEHLARVAAIVSVFAASAAALGRVVSDAAFALLRSLCDWQGVRGLGGSGSLEVVAKRLVGLPFLLLALFGAVVNHFTLSTRFCVSVATSDAFGRHILVFRLVV